MNSCELAQRLIEEGCNPSMYVVATHGKPSPNDAFTLTRDGTEWQVYYSERGHNSPAIYSSMDELQACEFFFQHIMSMPHEHCVGFFKLKQKAEALWQKLSEAGVSSRINPIPTYGGPNDPRFQVLVIGKAIFPARTILGDLLPIREAGA